MSRPALDNLSDLLLMHVVGIDSRIVADKIAHSIAAIAGRDGQAQPCEWCARGLCEKHGVNEEQPAPAQPQHGPTVPPTNEPMVALTATEKQAKPAHDRTADTCARCGTPTRGLCGDCFKLCWPNPAQPQAATGDTDYIDFIDTEGNEWTRTERYRALAARIEQQAREIAELCAAHDRLLHRYEEALDALRAAKGTR